MAVIVRRGLSKLSQMAEFSKGIRKYWMEAAKHRFGTVDGRAPEVLFVARGDKIELSGRPADEVHHCIPGHWAEEQEGQLAQEQVGIPLSRGSHRRPGRQKLPLEEDYSPHPDMGEAVIDYRKGNKRAYCEVSAKHRADAKAGNYPCGYDPEYARYLEEEMEVAAFMYTTETGRKKPMSGKPRPRKKHWADGLFD